MARMIDLSYEDSSAPVTARDAAIYAEMTKPAAKPRTEKLPAVNPTAVLAAAEIRSMFPQVTSLVAQAIVYLNHQCDGAHTVDGHGFSQCDATFGKSMAAGAQRFGHLTAGQFPYAQRLCQKYRKQLAAAGFDLVAIASEQAPQRAAPVHSTDAPAARPSRTQPIGLCVRIVRRTDRAALVETQHGKRQAWLPLSQVHFRERGDDGYGPVDIPLWLMQEKFPQHPVTEVTVNREEAHA